MKIRSYFWQPRLISPPELALRKLLRRSPSNYFVVGNAGDILAGELIRRRYDCPVVNDDGGGNRLLVVGSIGHRIQPGDVLCGIGTKMSEVPRASEVPVEIWALRGPMSREIFAKAGHDVSRVHFLLDPGLMMRFEMGDEARAARPQGAIFIPHYREREQHVRGLPRWIRYVDIDATPRQVARKILGAELVYASSLHGVIFAHALERPCVLVQPPTQEPLLKYEDHYAAVGLSFPKPLSSIWEAKVATAPRSPAEVRYSEADFEFPELDALRARGVAIDD